MSLRFLFVSCSLLLAAVAPAAPVPKLKATPITAANVDRVRAVLEADADVWRLVPGPDAGELTFVRWEKPVEVVDERTLKPLRTLVDGKPIHFAATAKGDRLAWCENDKTVRMRAADGTKVLELDAGDTQPVMTFSPDGKTLAVDCGTEVKVWDTDGKLVRALDCGAGGALTPVFSPDGKTLAAGSRNGTTRLFDADTGKLLHTLMRRESHGIAFRPDGKTLAVGYADGTLATWDVETGKELRSAMSGGKEVYAVAWNPVGDVLVTTGLSGKIVLWDPDTLKPLRELDAPEWVITVRFSPDGCRLYTAGGSSSNNKDRKVTVWAVDHSEK